MLYETKNMTDKYCGVHKIIQYIYSICLILGIINDYECDEVLKGASKEWHNCKITWQVLYLCIKESGFQ